MKIKRLKQQNDKLIEQNMALRQKTPTAEYAKKIDKNLEKFDDSNNDLLKLYKELHMCRLKNERTGLRYRLGVFMIGVRRFEEGDMIYVAN